ncbi:MAG: hypothetical protein LCH92_12440 [Proteobacteria bacterium]|nr:hypothetical protein [Pseudomonadota bacterium]
MAEPLDGFFFHPDGGSPDAQLARLLAGEHNPNFDSPFSATFDEVDDEIRGVEAERKRLLARLVMLREKLVSLRAHRQQVTEAVERFEATGEIAPLLIPACKALSAKEQAALRKADDPIKNTEIDNAKATLAASLPGGWDVTETTADDEFVYVTIKRRREVVAAERPSHETTREGIVEKVKQAFEAYRRDFLNSARPLRIVTTTASPRASP